MMHAMHTNKLTNAKVEHLVCYTVKVEERVRMTLHDYV